MEEQQRVAIIRDLHQKAEAQRASNEAWAKKVEDSQEMADRLAKKVSTPMTSENRDAQDVCPGAGILHTMKLPQTNCTPR